MGINAGDGINFLKLCGTATPLMDTLPLMRQNCRSEVGVFAFRMDSNNPNQSNSMLLFFFFFFFFVFFFLLF